MMTTEMTMAPPPSPAPRLWKGSDVGLMTLTIVGGMAVGTAGLTGALVLANGGQMPERLPVAYAVGIVAMQSVVMTIAVWLFGLQRRGLNWPDIGWVRTTPQWIVAAVSLFVVLRFVAVALAALMAQLGFTSLQPQALAPEGFSWVGLIGMLVFAGVLVPIAEELFFRGVVYRWLRDKWGVAVGAVVSGLVFGVAHFEPATVVPAIIMGIALALVFERSKSLWPGILIHILNNASAIALLYILLASGAQIPGLD